MEQFKEAYIRAALWSSVESESEKPFDEIDAEFSDSALEQIESDCLKFWLLARDIIIGQDIDFESAGHDFWLTRNGHGSGFWDRGYRQRVSDRLCEITDRFPEIHLYLGDNGKIYLA